ncbi:hypothetical protein SCA6_012716 [Theobroma cacao]
MSRNKGSVDRGGDSPELPGCAGIQVKFCTCPFLDGGLVQVVWCLLDLKNGLVTVINGNHEILVQVGGRREIPRAATASAPVHVDSREEIEIVCLYVPWTSLEPPTTATARPSWILYSPIKLWFANLVASGVARNMCRVGNYMKETVDDILFTNRKRPK